jgi:hypothetical protein
LEAPDQLAEVCLSSSLLFLIHYIRLSEQASLV